jgi:hypothetical protein
VETYKISWIYIGTTLLGLLFIPAGIWGVLFLSLPLLVGSGIGIYLDYQNYLSQKDLLRRRAEKLGLPHDALRQQIERAEKQNEWGNTPLERVEKIEAYLQKLCDAHIHLFDDMPKVKVELINKPIQDWPDKVEYNVFVPGLVYKVHKGQCSSALGGSGSVFVKKDFFEGAKLNELIYVLKHEMTHCWIDWKGIEDGDHGPQFQKKLREVS